MTKVFGLLSDSSFLLSLTYALINNTQNSWGAIRTRKQQILLFLRIMILITIYMDA